jgi:hypothetical protein
MLGEIVGIGLVSANGWLSETLIAADESTVEASAGVAAKTARVLGGTVDGTAGEDELEPERRAMPPTTRPTKMSAPRLMPMTHGALEGVFAAWVPAICSIYLRLGGRWSR